MSIRQYYHSITNQPIQSSDFEADSDGEDTEWQRKASGQLIEEFIDVNRGEKELMKLWNYFISKNTQYGIILMLLHRLCSCYDLGCSLENIPHCYVRASGLYV